MKRIGLIWVSAGVAAALLALLLLLLKQKTSQEIVRLSEAMVTAQVQAYYKHPSTETLEVVRKAVANHRKAIEQAKLSPEARETAEQSLWEQIFIVRGIAHNDDLKM